MKTIFTITALVLFSLGTLAQRPAKSLQTPQNTRSKSVSERNAFHRQKNDDRQLRPTEFSSPGHFKSSQAILSEKMDSVVWAEWRTETQSWKIFGQNYFEYDSMGNNTLDTWFGTDYDTIFPSYGGQVEFAFDANNRLVELYDYDWTDSTGFELYSKDLFDYDANGNLTVEIDYNWNKVSQSYYPSYTDTSTYDGMGNRLENTSYRYDTMIMAWTPDYRNVEVYDSAGMRIHRNDFRWYRDSSR